MRPQNTTRTFTNNAIRNRLADLQKRFLLKDTARQILHNEIEAAARYWFVRSGGVEADFKKLFNSVSK